MNDPKPEPPELEPDTMDVVEKAEPVDAPVPAPPTFNHRFRSGD